MVLVITSFVGLSFYFFCKHLSFLIALWHFVINSDLVFWNRWKERLKGKYIRSLDPQGKSVYFDVKSWTFMKDGFDDFRDGLPPVFDDGAFLKVSHLMYFPCI